jgi:hypothetical protein
VLNRGSIHAAARYCTVFGRLQDIIGFRAQAFNGAIDRSEFGALPESCAAAWACLHDTLQLRRGATVLLRGATSALGPAATALAAPAGVNVMATTRVVERSASTRQLGARRTVPDAAYAEAFGAPEVFGDMPLVVLSQGIDSPTIARQLNERPRKTLGVETPAEMFSESVSLIS